VFHIDTTIFASYGKKSDFHLADRNSFFLRESKILFSRFYITWGLNLISFSARSQYCPKKLGGGARAFKELFCPFALQSRFDELNERIKARYKRIIQTFHTLKLW
jgi:hypothetical protein